MTGEDCVLWTGATNALGYGIATRPGRSILAHRLEYEKAYGRIPDGLVIHHTCHVRNCINTNHLAAVARSVNASIKRWDKFWPYQDKRSDQRAPVKSGKYAGMYRLHLRLTSDEKAAAKPLVKVLGGPVEGLELLVLAAVHGDIAAPSDRVKPTAWDSRLDPAVTPQAYATIRSALPPGGSVDPHVTSRLAGLISRLIDATGEGRSAMVARAIDDLLSRESGRVLTVEQRERLAEVISEFVRGDMPDPA